MCRRFQRSQTLMLVSDIRTRTNNLTVRRPGLHRKAQRLPSLIIEIIDLPNQWNRYTLDQQSTSSRSICERRIPRRHAGPVGSPLSIIEIDWYSNPYDRFGGDAAPNSADPNAQQDVNPSIIEQVKIRAAETVQSFMIDMWLARQTPEKVMPILQKVIEGAKEEFADAVANGGGIYAIGYCFGGKYVLLLGSDMPDTAAAGSQAPKDEEQGAAKPAPLIKAGALAHGTT